jgi:hypothetical protein
MGGPSVPLISTMQTCTMSRTAQKVAAIRPTCGGDEEGGHVGSFTASINIALLSLPTLFTRRDTGHMPNAFSGADLSVSAIGSWRTGTLALHMSAFGGRANMCEPAAPY